MTQEYLDILDIIYQFLIVGIIIFILVIVLTAVYSMVKNQAAHWESVAFVSAVLLLGLVLIWQMPALGLRSVRLGLVKAKPEAYLLQQEIRTWVNDIIPPATPVVYPTELPPIVVEHGGTPIPTAVWPVPTDSATSLPEPTQTSTPRPTSTPTPTMTLTPTRHMVNLNGALVTVPPSPYPATATPGG